MRTKAKECLTVKRQSAKMGRTDKSSNSYPPTQTTEVKSVNTLPVPQSIKPQGRRIMRPQSVAALCGVSRRTVYNWMQENRIEWVEGITGRFIYADSIPLFYDLEASFGESL